MPTAFKNRFDELYLRLNQREFVHPDPLEFLYRYEALCDREVAGLVASSLAYGRVAQILRSVACVLGPLGPRPCAFLLKASRPSLSTLFAEFRHRFTTGEELVALLWGARRAIERFGSLEACFSNGLLAEDETVLPALSVFVQALRKEERSLICNSLLPSPDKGSACKRLNLFLRWMVRKDTVDPGGWDQVAASKLIVPLDTHMHGISLAFGLTRRRQTNMRTALEITAGFRSIAPNDPVRYDFALTRLGIRDDMDVQEFIAGFDGRDTTCRR